MDINKMNKEQYIYINKLIDKEISLRNLKIDSIFEKILPNVEERYKLSTKEARNIVGFVISLYSVNTHSLFNEDKLKDEIRPL